MGEIAVNLLGRGDYVLVFLTIVLVAIYGIVKVVVGVFSKSEKQIEFEELQHLLAKPEIMELVKAEKTNLSEVVETIRKKSPASQNGMSSFFGKIARDIEWDVSGLIGVGVTIVLLYMTVSGTISDIPEQVYTGWLLILGYFFGKGGKAA